LGANFSFQLGDANLAAHERSREPERMTVKKASWAGDARDLIRISHGTTFREIQVKPHVQLWLATGDFNRRLEGRSRRHQAGRRHDAFAASHRDRFIDSNSESEIVGRYDQLPGGVHFQRWFSST